MEEDQFEKNAKFSILFGTLGSLLILAADSPGALGIMKTVMPASGFLLILASMVGFTFSFFGKLTNKKTYTEDISGINGGGRLVMYWIVAVAVILFWLGIAQHTYG